MEYSIGMPLIWKRNNKFDKPEKVTVAELRSRGHAKLSNGWVVDEDGFAPGTDRVPGGSVRSVHAPTRAVNMG